MRGNVILELSPLEVERLLGAIMDEDKDETLTFLKECLGKKIEEKLRHTARSHLRGIVCA